MDAETPYIEALQTKFRKSRLVPLHPITVDILRDYGEARSRRHFHSLSDAFFISSKGNYLDYYTVWRTFATLKRQAGIRSCETGIGECVDAGIKAAVVISAGFREQGPKGAALEQQIQHQLRRGTMRPIGPNCLGVINPAIGLNVARTIRRFVVST